MHPTVLVQAGVFKIASVSDALHIFLLGSGAALEIIPEEFIHRNLLLSTRFAPRVNIARWFFFACADGCVETQVLRSRIYLKMHHFYDCSVI